MIGLLAVWLGSIALLLSCGMLIYRPLFHDLTLAINMLFAIPLSLTLSTIALWLTRHQKQQFGPLRVQAVAAASMALLAAAIVYALVHFAQRVPAT